MKVLVTGANGFVGSALVPLLVEAGHNVIAATGPGGELSTDVESRLPLDLTAPRPLGDEVDDSVDAVVHLAAVASSSDARRNPALAWEVNTVGSVKLAEAFGAMAVTRRKAPRFMLVSTCDVYRTQTVGAALTEESPLEPVNSYSASKLAAEVGCMEVARRTGLDLIVVRPFPHSGAGQDTRFVLPDFARKVLEAKRDGRREVTVGSLSVVREMLDVRDVANAYLSMLDGCEPGEVYNIARGEAYPLSDLFELVCEAADYHVTPVQPEGRTGVTGVVLGNAGKLRAATNWTPDIPLSQTVENVVAAQRVALGLDR